MDDRQLDALIDSAIDREIQGTLGVEPSPVFLARLRTKIADEPLPIAGSRAFISLTGLAAVVALVVGFSFWHQYDPSVPSSSAHTLERRPAAIVLTPHPEIVSTNASAPLWQTTTTQSPSLRHASLEVLISADDTEALQQLITGARESRFHLSFEDNMQLEKWGDVTELTVQPLAIAPLEWPTTEGVPQ